MLFRSIFTVFLLFSTTLAWAERYALVIGNEAYATGYRLNNPREDAKVVAGLFKQANFRVTLKLNLDLETMENTITRFINKLHRGDTMVFYYSGHAI